MAVQVVRFRAEDGPRWGVHRSGWVTCLSGQWATTADFLTQGGVEAARDANPDSDGELDIFQLDLMSPVTADRDFICLGMNYASHLKELGRDPKEAVHNILFHKASSSICGPRDDVVRPAHVRALDYEVEIGLVVGTAVTGPREVRNDNLHDFIAGLVITNDISARDVQLSHEQFCKAKSYRTFAPTGPFLTLVGEEELCRFGDLVLSLSVNGEQRQLALASDMIHGPVETLRELSEIRDLRPGDLIATGTPGGVALKAPAKWKAKLAMLLSPVKRAELLAKMAEKDPAYLRPGDSVTCRVATEDGDIDLGCQRNTVVAAGT